MNKLDWTLIYTLVGALITNLIGIGVLIWNLSAWRTKLVIRIDKNEKDINRGMASVREMFKREMEDFARNISYKNRQQDGEIRHISRHLEETTSYRHPTFNDFDNQK